MREFSFLLITFLLAYYISSAQVVDISILQFKEEYKGDEPTWYTCNEDSVYYKLDTIVFSTNGTGCCNSINIKIRKKNISNIHELHLCTEPPTAIASAYINRGKIKKRKGSYHFCIYKLNEVYKSFKIIELSKNSYFDSNNYQRFYYKMVLVKEN